MKNLVKWVLRTLVCGVAKLLQLGAVGRNLDAQLLAMMTTRTEEVVHGGVRLTFTTPNEQNRWRARTFATKEPETLEWIDTVPRGAVLWDVGANVGLYTCYAAKARGCEVIAFEPSVFNLEMLARNVVLNGLTRQVTLMPLPLSGRLAVSQLNMTSTEWGGALSTFGESFGHDGRALRPIFEYQTLGVSMQDAVELLRLPWPDYIKMDVDGIEHLILSGGDAVLARVEGILIEVNDDFREQAVGCAEQLARAGLTLVEKRHSPIVTETEFRGAFNQIWARDVPPSAGR